MNKQNFFQKDYYLVSFVWVYDVIKMASIDGVPIYFQNLFL